MKPYEETGLKQILAFVKLEDRHQSTGATTHFVGGELMPRPNELSIVSYGKDGQFYLFYLDENGAWMTDTFHETIESALRQAQFEFEVLPPDWNWFRGSSR